MISLQHAQFACIRAISNSSTYVRRSPWLSPATQPDHTKTYADRTDLFASRIFIPHSNQPSERRQLPLVVCVHGGGFVVNNPAVDDPLSRQLADEADCVVVSIDYRKAPQSKFPRAYDDVVALSLAAMDDADLPLDRSRIVLCGSSAGGNLVLAAAQNPLLRDRIHGVVTLYPACDFVPSGEEKMSRRPDPSVPDFLGNNYNAVTQLYLNDADNFPLTDTRLSPTYFASRDDLPANMLFIGCEHDMLCHEAEEMADKLVATTTARPVKIDTSTGWRAGGVRWHLVRSQTHGFDHFPAKTADGEQRRTAAREETYAMISRWLIDVFSTGSNDL